MYRNNILLKIKDLDHCRSLETCLRGPDRRITVVRDLLEAMLVSAKEDSHFKILITDADRFDPMERHLVDHLRRKHPDLKPIYLSDFLSTPHCFAACESKIPCDSLEIRALLLEVDRRLL